MFLGIPLDGLWRINLVSGVVHLLLHLRLLEARKRRGRGRSLKAVKMKRNLLWTLMVFRMRRWSEFWFSLTNCRLAAAVLRWRTIFIFCVMKKSRDVPATALPLMVTPAHIRHFSTRQRGCWIPLAGGHCVTSSCSSTHRSNALIPPSCNIRPALYLRNSGNCGLCQSPPSRSYRALALLVVEVCSSHAQAWMEPASQEQGERTRSTCQRRKESSHSWLCRRPSARSCRGNLILKKWCFNKVFSGYTLPPWTYLWVSSVESGVAVSLLVSSVLVNVSFNLGNRSSYVLLHFFLLFLRSLQLRAGGRRWSHECELCPSSLYIPRRRSTLFVCTCWQCGNGVYSLGAFCSLQVAAPLVNFPNFV